MSAEAWLGTAVGVVLALVVYIWKLHQSKISKIEAELETEKGRNDDLDKKIALIQQSCKTNHAGDVKELDIRRILKEEFDRFKLDFNASFINEVKVTLLEQGYLSAPKTKKKSPQRVPK